nr:hypothetical protein [Tanacetum cinerariifolium]
MGFQPAKQVYRQVSKKNNVCTSGNKKKDVEPTIEVSKSNSFDVLNSVEMMLIWYTTPIVENFDKKKRFIIDGTATLVDDEGQPLTMVNSSGDHDNDDEVALVDNDVANLLASMDVGYVTNSLLEQWADVHSLYGGGALQIGF